MISIGVHVDLCFVCIDARLYREHTCVYVIEVAYLHVYMQLHKASQDMMTSSNGNIFHVTDPGALGKKTTKTCFVDKKMFTHWYHDNYLFSVTSFD